MIKSLRSWLLTPKTKMPSELELNTLKWENEKWKAESIRLSKLILADYSKMFEELKAERDEWRAKAEGWFCPGCKKFLKDVADAEKIGAK